MNAPRSDAELVRAHREGDGQAFAQLADRHLGLVHVIAMSRLRDPESSEDLAQEALLHALLHLERLKRPERFSQWLAQIARNLAADWRRRDQRRSRLVPLVPIDDAGQIPHPTQKGVRREMEEHDERRAVRQALWDLPERQREMVMLHLVEGLSQPEIAQRLGVNQATVSRQVRRGLDTMREVLTTTLRDAVSSMRLPKAAHARTGALILAAVALPATAKASLAAATESAIPSGLLGGVGLGAALIKAKGLAMAMASAGLLGVGVWLAASLGGGPHDSAATAPEEEGTNLLFEAIEGFREREGRYPRSVLGSDPRSVANTDPLMQQMPTFDREDFGRMTAPYPGVIFFDVHSPNASPRAYQTEGERWILVCPGYDDDYDFNPLGVWSPEMTLASPEIALVAFDPTNGIRSEGDMIDIGPIVQTAAP